MTSGPALVADIGGTNARFAIAQSQSSGYHHERSYVCEDFPSIEAAIAVYLEEIGATAPALICLAVAGPIVNGAVSFTNSDWYISTVSLMRTFATHQVQLLNDFEAVAHGLAVVADKFVVQLGSVEPVDLLTEDFTIAAVGPGTGLGVAGLLSRQGQLATLVTEGGHVGFSPLSRLQMQVLERLRSRYGRVSNERLVSGSGIENIYWALQPVEEFKVPSAAEIFSRYAEQADPLALVAVDLFFEIFGQVAGDMALTLGAYQGVYLAGGIAQRYPNILASSRFRTGFESKGRLTPVLEKVPTALVTHPNLGLLGAAAYSSRISS